MFPRADDAHAPHVIVIIYKDRDQSGEETKLIHIASSVEAAKIQAYTLLIDSPDPWKRKKPFDFWYQDEHPYRRYAEWTSQTEEYYKYLSIEQIPLDQAIKSWRYVFGHKNK